MKIPFFFVVEIWRNRSFSTKNNRKVIDQHLPDALSSHKSAETIYRLTDPRSEYWSFRRRPTSEVYRSASEPAKLFDTSNAIAAVGAAATERSLRSGLIAQLEAPRPESQSAEGIAVCSRLQLVALLCCT
jgi:hypothetical protein